MVQYLHDMGQNSSLPKGRRKSLRSFGKKSINIKSNLSHTFALNDNDDRIEQLNINIASEEELMTLVGVNRKTAQNIIEHRKAIGRFRKVEDLALVGGIGAEKLELIRPEICVSSVRKRQSCASSRAPSYDSLKSSDSRVTVKSNRQININTASVFELQSVYGITQEIAARILHYRTKKGYFQKVDDLIKVKHIDRIRLDNISRFLTVENTDNEISENEETPRPSILTNGYATPTHNGKKCNGSIPLNHSISNGLTLSSTIDIFELLSTYSPRPIVQETFKFCRDGEDAVRISSWNLHEFSFEKASNMGVKEVVCRTILENGWSILAIQNVTSVAALKTICEELNKPTLRRIDEWKDKNHNWNFCMLDVHDSKLGFIYDCGGAVNIELLSLSNGPEDTKLECEVLIATFRVGDLTLQLVNMMLDKKVNIQVLQEKSKELISQEDMMVFVFIDLSNLKDSVDGYLSLGGLSSLFSAETNTSCLTPTAQKSSHHVSNILFNKTLQQQLTGQKGVVRQGLTHLAIPNGWSWGGPASPFAPIWTELFVNADSGTAL